MVKDKPLVYNDDIITSNMTMVYINMITNNDVKHFKSSLKILQNESIMKASLWNYFSK